MSKSVIIVGAGMGGLALALRLSHRGFRVTVLEKNNFLGGRNHRVSVGGSTFDSGPTLLMMLDPLKKLFDDVGESLEIHLPLQLVEPGYRAWFASGKQVDASTDRGAMRPQINSLGGASAVAAYERLLSDVAHLYDSSLGPFIRQDYLKVRDWMKVSHLRAAVKLGVFGGLWRQITRRFDNDELRMLFSFQTMYLGLSPFKAPWVYSTLIHMEYGEGIWYTKGGITRLAEVLADLAATRGCDIQLDSEVSAITSKGVTLSNGSFVEADFVVCNADLPYAEESLLGRTKRKVEGSCGALMFYWHASSNCPKLQHHNVFLSADYRGNFEAIFDQLEHAPDPSFYVCVSSVSDPAQTSPGCQNIMVLVPCPRSNVPFTCERIAGYRAVVTDRLTREVGFDPASVQEELVRQPSDWSSQLNLYEGSAFGLGHALRQSAMFRPKIRDRKMPNVFFVGASTTPGNGIPMVLISAELVEARIAEASV